MQNLNPRLKRNSVCFGVFTLIIHIVACVMFGVYFRLPGQTTLANFTPLFITFCHGMLVVVGKCPLMQGLGFCSPT